MRTRRFPLLAFAALLVPLGLAPGCRVSLPREPVPYEDNAELIVAIAEMPYVNADAACRAVYILVTGDVFPGEYDELLDAMRQRDLPVADIAPHEAPNRQEIAKLLAEVADVPAGVNYALTGLGRYALRDLQYHRVVRTPNDYGPVSGGEFLGMLARTEELIAARRKTGEKVELGQEPKPVPAAPAPAAQPAASVQPAAPPDEPS